jgi:hypothetical protein
METAKIEQMQLIHRLALDLAIAQQNVIALSFELGMAKERIKILTPPCTRSSSGSVCDLPIIAEDEATLFNEDDADAVDWEDGFDMDMDIVVQPRKTRRDILTPFDAIKACKSSKTHKLRPRSPKRDRTKTQEAKGHTKQVRRAHAMAGRLAVL